MSELLATRGRCNRRFKGNAIVVCFLVAHRHSAKNIVEDILCPYVQTQVIASREGLHSIFEDRKLREAKNLYSLGNRPLDSFHRQKKTKAKQMWVLFLSSALPQPLYLIEIPD